jgi:hypothetical protein
VCITWTDEGHPLHLNEQVWHSDDTDPKALVCYGLLLYGMDTVGQASWAVQASPPARLRLAASGPQTVDRI